MKGRVPIPTRLKLMKGSPRYRAKQDRNEPKPPTSLTTAAAKKLYRLSKREEVIFDGLHPVLTGMGLLTDFDIPAFVNYCRAQAIINAISDSLLQGDGDKRPMTHQERMRHKDALNVVIKIGSQFGMTPASRTRLTGGAASMKAEQDFEDLITPKKSKPRPIYPLNNDSPDRDSGGGSGDAPDAG